jgi:hypothetical protein
MKNSLPSDEYGCNREEIGCLASLAHTFPKNFPAEAVIACYGCCAHSSMDCAQGASTAMLCHDFDVYAAQAHVLLDV